MTLFMPGNGGCLFNFIGIKISWGCYFTWNPRPHSQTLLLASTTESGPNSGQLSYALQIQQGSASSPGSAFLSLFLLFLPPDLWSICPVASPPAPQD